MPIEYPSGKVVTLPSLFNTTTLHCILPYSMKHAFDTFGSAAVWFCCVCCLLLVLYC
jgi:hypothetical protein